MGLAGIVTAENDPCIKCSYSPSLTVTRKWRIDIDVSAISQNKLKGRYSSAASWRYYSKKKEFMAALVSVTARVPKADSKRRVTFTRVYDGREFDPDNLVSGFKGCRDVLTELGLIVDDNRKWLEAHYSQEKGDRDRVYFLIEEIQEWPHVRQEDLPKRKKPLSRKKGSGSTIQPNRTARRNKRKPPNAPTVPG